MIAFLALPEKSPTPAEIVECLGVVLGSPVDAVVDGDTIDLSVVDQRVRIEGKPERIAKQLLSGACATAWYWPDAAQVLATHHSHLAVVVDGETGSPIHKSLLLTKLVAGLGDRFGYLGVYWDSATMVHSDTAFREAAAEMDPGNLPVKLWVDFRFLPDAEDTLSLVTVGLDTLQHMEIEILRSRRTPQEIMGIAYSVACYVVDGGKIEDDQTVGRGEDERYLLKYRPSTFEPERTVMGIHM